MNVKFPLLAVEFSSDASPEQVDQWFLEHPDIIQKYRQMGLIFSQKKSFYESGIKIQVQSEPFKVILHLDERKQKIRLNKMKIRGSGHQATGRPKKIKEQIQQEQNEEVKQGE